MKRLFILFLPVFLAVVASAANPSKDKTKRPQAQSLAPYKSSAAAPWNYDRAAHLLRRAGFGGDYRRIEELARIGPAKAVDQLMGADTNMLGRFEEELARQHFDSGEPIDIKAWWIYRMMHSPAPLQEKMSLFWHNHFATSLRKVRAPELMLRQNEMFRRYALGDFQKLVLEVSKDPAMIQWLDNNNNLKGKPNENYAREVMELFTLGIGHYTESDIKEAARAFTGWQMDYSGFYFNPEQHDFGSKTFMGQTGEFNGGDIIRIIFQQPACAEYISKKLFEFFAYESPDEALVRELASLLTRSHFQIRPVVDRILRSQAFFSARAMEAQIKSPVDYVVGTAQAMEIDVDARGARMAARAVAQMGQNLFEPPSVKGWDGGRAWINTATLLNRQNFIKQLTENRSQNLASLRKDLKLEESEPAKALDSYARALLQRPLAEKDRAELMPYLAQAKEAGSPEMWQDLTYRLLTLPQYQLN
jgi:uncharacterized protein (DUF1800 family)